MRQLLAPVMVVVLIAAGPAFAATKKKGKGSRPSAPAKTEPKVEAPASGAGEPKVEAPVDAAKEGATPAAAASTEQPTPLTPGDAPKAEGAPAVVLDPAKPASAAGDVKSSAAPSAVARVVEAPVAPVARPAVRASLGFHGFNRALRWDAPETSGLASDTTPFAPGIAAGAEWFPGAHFTSGLPSWFGLFGAGEFALGLKMRQGADTFPTHANRLRGGLVLRVPVTARVDLELLGAMSNQVFFISPTNEAGAKRDAVPSVAFLGPWAGVGVRIAKLGPVSLDARAGAVYPFKLGEFGSQDFFPRTRGIGVDASAGVSLGVVENIELRVGVDWTRYFLWLNADPAGQRLGTTASDQYLGGSLAIMWVM